MIYFEVLAAGTVAARGETFDLTLKACQIAFQATCDKLLSLPHLRGVEDFWYQQETTHKVMEQFRGQPILADAAGLGKTIEARLVVKEYMVRSLVKTALILVPRALLNQWQEALQEKWSLSFEFGRRPAGLRGLREHHNLRHCSPAEGGIRPLCFSCHNHTS